MGKLLVMLLVTSSAMQAQGPDDLATGRRYVQWFYDGPVDSLWVRFGGELLAVVPTAAALETGRQQMLGQLGAESAILDERVSTESGRITYLRRVTFGGPQQFIVIAVFDTDSVYGFGIRPAPGLAPTSYLDYETRTPLRLPFSGAWYVFWGGGTLEQNYHAAYADQRFAYDLLVMEGGISHRGDGTRNEQFFCWGRPITAPGAGTVVASANDVPDNVPGEMNPARALGNHVIINHGNGEFSFMAHFQLGSVQVAVGDMIAAGDPLGVCGNSGNTSEPHLHYHLQTTAVFGQGEGLPAYFLDYVANDEPVARGIPVKGQVIRSRNP